MEEKNYDIGIRSGWQEEDQDDFLSKIDFDKLISVCRKSLPWIVLILILTNTLAYLFLRYTKPLYQSYSDLKLEVKSDASLLGFGNLNDNANASQLSGEIALIKSNVFFNRVIDALDLDISYHAKGNVNTLERYKNAPFRVEYLLNTNKFYDRPINFEQTNKNEFTLTYLDGDKEVTNNYRFGERIEAEDFEFVITRTNQNKSESEDSDYFFIINSHNSLIRYLSSNLEVVPLNRTANTIRISFKDHNKYKARDLVNAIDTLYLEYTKEEKSKANKQRIDFLDEQLHQTERQLAGFESYFENFTINNKTTNVKSDLGTLIQLMVQLDSQKISASKRLTALNEIFDQVSNDELNITKISGSNLVPSSVMSTLEKINNLASQKALLLTTYNENTFAVRKKEEELKILRDGFLTELNESKRLTYNEIKSLGNRQKEIESNFVKLPSKGTEFGQKTRSYNIYEKSYLALIQKKLEFQIAEAGTVPDFEVLSYASVNNQPIYPEKLTIYGIGAVSGLILSLLFIGIRYVLHNKVSSLAELESLTPAPILGAVPYYSAEEMNVTRLVIHNNPKSAMSESLRSIRTNMEFISANRAKKVISITSTISGEGKTFVSVNLGGIIAMTRLKTLIIDLDMRNPKVHKAFSDGNDNYYGVSTILINKHEASECIRESSLENLHYIPAGPTPPNPSELIMTQEFDNMLNELKAMYDIIILDTPPIGLVTDGVLAMKKADLPLYVVRADYSKKIFAKTLNRLIQVNRFNNLAVILNSVKTGKQYGYGYGYYEEDNKRNGKSFSLKKKKELSVK